MARIVYFVHDLNDPAVTRRVKMLRAAGEEVVVAGFYRGDGPPATIAGAEALPLARTADARLMQRAFAVVRNLVFARRVLRAAEGAEVVIGRNLEALALAERAHRAMPGTRLVYECLDIHRLLLGASLPARLVQRIEASLLQRIDLLIVSSPAFLRDHFARRPGFAAPTLLVENKLLTIGAAPPQAAPVRSGPPWTIGWLGNLRCRRTFEELAALVRRHDGRVRLLVAGRPSSAVFADLPAALAELPHCTYLGPYSPDQLPEIYARCHFVWAIDWFEEGLNSRWLLPNRLYEAPAFGTVPIALASVETGAWLAQRNAGLLLDDGLEQLDPTLAAMDAPAYAALRAAIDAIPRDDLLAGDADCAALAEAIVAG